MGNEAFSGVVHLAVLSFILVGTSASISYLAAVVKCFFRSGGKIFQDAWYNGRVTKLSDWLASELEDRGWSMRELGRRSGVSHTQISDVISGKARPGSDFCQAVARGLGEPPGKIYRLAGLLPPVSEARRREFEELAEQLAALPDGAIRDEAMASIIAITASARKRAQELEEKNEEEREKDSGQ